MTSPIWVVIVAAAVGSLAASFVTLVGQFLERRSRQRELFLAKAVEMAHERAKQIREIAAKEGRPEVLHPSITLTAGAFAALESIFRTGNLPPEWRRQLDQQAVELEEVAARLRR